MQNGAPQGAVLVDETRCAQTVTLSETGDSREQTVFSLTLVGRVALTTYVAHLSELVQLSSGNDQRTGATVSAKRE